MCNPFTRAERWGLHKLPKYEQMQPVPAWPPSPLLTYSSITPVQSDLDELYGESGLPTPSSPTTSRYLCCIVTSHHPSRYPYHHLHCSLTNSSVVPKAGPPCKLENRGGRGLQLCVRVSEGQDHPHSASLPGYDRAYN